MRKLLAWALMLAAIPAAAERAGQVKKVLPAGFIVHQKVSTEARDAAPVEWNDVLRTNPQGRMRIALEDQSLITVGSNTEMRIVKHDIKSQQTVVELLYGRMRNRVSKLTVVGGSYNVRTPTAVIGVIGSEFTADVERASVSPVTAVTSEQIQNLPASRQSVASLLDLTPGVLPNAASSGPTINDYPSDITRVFAMDGVIAVMNIDPKVVGLLFLLPGEAAIIERGKPPRKFTPSQQADSPESFQRAFFDAFPNCNGLLDLRNAGESQKYKIYGRGTSTGQAFDIEIENTDPNCPLEVFVPNGIVLKPKGFVKRVIVGLLLGGNPPLKDFQLMIAEGGAFQGGPFKAPAAGGMYFKVPEAGKATFPMRGFCLELHKLPPQSNTEYKVDEDKSKELGDNARILEAVHRMYNQGQLRPTVHHPDGIIQWALWASRERMDEKEFKEQFTKRVEANLKAQKKKFDKAAKEETEKRRVDMWDKVQKVLAEVKKIKEG